MQLNMFAKPIKVFFDTEFTHKGMTGNGYLIPPYELISIGCVSESGLEFYAENQNVSPLSFEPWIQEFVEIYLDPVNHAIPYLKIEELLKEWIEGLGRKVQFYSDNPAYDFHFIEEMFKGNWPKNLDKVPNSAKFDNESKKIKYEKHYKLLLKQHEDQQLKIEAEWFIKQSYQNTPKPKLVGEHHALFDAKMIKDCYLHVMKG